MVEEKEEDLLANWKSSKNTTLNSLYRQKSHGVINKKQNKKPTWPESSKRRSPKLSSDELDLNEPKQEKEPQFWAENMDDRRGSQAVTLEAKNDSSRKSTVHDDMAASELARRRTVFQKDSVGEI